MATDTGVLTADGVRLGRSARDRRDAIDQCGRLLLELGAVEPDYLPAMHEREQVVSTFVGEGVAIPHGTEAARGYVRRTRLAVLQFPHGVDWDGNDVRLCVAIAAIGDEHVALLSTLATALLDPRRAKDLRAAADAETVVALLNPADEKRIG